MDTNQNFNNQDPKQKHKKHRRVWLIIGLCCLFVGIILTIIGSVLCRSMKLYDENDLKPFSGTIPNITSESNLNLDIDVAFAKVNVVTDPTATDIKVDASRAVVDEADVYKKGDTAYIKVNTKNFTKRSAKMLPYLISWGNDNKEDSFFSNVTIVIPENTFDSIKLECVGCQIDVGGLTSDDLTIDSSFSEFKGRALNATNVKTNNSFGAFYIYDSAFGTGKYNSDFGSMKMYGTSVKTSDFDIAFGELDADLIGDINDYEIDADDDLSRVDINDRSARYFGDNDNASHEMDIDVSFGDADINIYDGTVNKNNNDMTVPTVPTVTTVSEPAIETTTSSSSTTTATTAVTDKDGNIADINGLKLVP